MSRYIIIRGKKFLLSLRSAYSFTQSGYFYRASSNWLLLRGASDTARILCRSFTQKRHRQLWVKDLPKVPTWRLERESNPRPSGWELSTQPMRHHFPQLRVSQILAMCTLWTIVVIGIQSPISRWSNHSNRPLRFGFQPTYMLIWAQCQYTRRPHI